MSRSIHTTWSERHTERRSDYEDDIAKSDRLKKIDQDLQKKHQIKKQIQSERQSKVEVPNILTSIDSEAVPINVIDDSEFIHYPAAQRDIAGVLKKMPFDVFVGLHSINLCLGAEFQKDEMDDFEETARDPFTGRVCVSECEPLYFSNIIGTYWPNTCKIFLYAYVYNPNDFKNELEIVEAFLRLKMLCTFVHEVAHHDDNMRRRGRGRWLHLTELKREGYAEFKEDEWAVQAVLPYLLETYPVEYDRLAKWIEDEGGVKFSFEKLAKESGGIVTPFSAVLDLFRNYWRDTPKNKTMLEFARDLHCGDYFEECLTAINYVLNDNPKDSEALGLKADTLIHMEKYHDAKTVATCCLSIDPNNIESIGSLADIHLREGDWNSLKEICSRGMEVPDVQAWVKYRFIKQRIPALLHLGDFTAAALDCDTLPETGRYRLLKASFTALISFLKEDFESSCSIVTTTLQQKELIGQPKAIIKAINNQVNRFGYDLVPLELNEFETDFLRENGIDILLSMVGVYS